MTLTEFLLARIAEDEADALRWKAFAWPSGDCTECGGDSGEGVPDFDPARVMAECEAKRRIVEAVCMSNEVLRPTEVKGRYDRVLMWEPCPEENADIILPLLALPYADHPDYREEWRP